MLPCSTGVIGERLPIDRMEAALEPLVRELSPEGLELFSQAILTTDTVSKTAVQEVALKKGMARIVGIAKGAGMIAPDETAFAYLEGRDFVVPDDIKRLALPVLAHRLVLNFEAEADGRGTRDVIHELLEESKGWT